MKKLMTILFSACLIFSISSCDDDETTTTTCDTALTAYGTALADFLAADTTDLSAYETYCETIKAAALDLIDKCDVQAIITSQGISQQAWDDAVAELQGTDCTP